jgi:hypothetical protein
MVKTPNQKKAAAQKKAVVNFVDLRNEMKAQTKRATTSANSVDRARLRWLAMATPKR